MAHHLTNRYFLHITHAIHTAVVLGVMPLIGLVCAAYATVAYGATTTVTLGVGDTSILVEGKTAPGGLVTIVDGTSIAGTTVATADGLFSKKLTAVAPGIHHLQIYTRDAHNRLSDSIRIELSATEHFQTDAYVFLPPTLAADQTIVNPKDPITYRGSTYPNAIVTLQFSEDTPYEQTYEITANGQGDWSQTIPTDELPLGTYEAYAFAVDTDTTEQSYSTRPLAVTILLPPPQPKPQDPTSQPVQPAPGPKPRPIRQTTIQPLSNEVVTESPVLIAGTAAPFAQIELFNGGRPVGSTFADRQGKWSISLSLHDPEYVLRARACTTTACSGLSNTLRFRYQPQTIAQHFWIWLYQYAFTIPEGERINLRLHSGNGTTPLTVVADWGDGKPSSRQYDSDKFTLGHTYKRAGNYHANITVTDANNKSATALVSVRVTGEGHTQPLRWPLLLALLLALLLVVVSAYIYWRIHHRTPRRKHNNKDPKHT